MILGCKDTVFQRDMEIFKPFFFKKHIKYVSLHSILIDLLHETDQNCSFNQ